MTNYEHMSMVAANAIYREGLIEREERDKEIKWMMTVVNDVLGNDDLCRGCADGEERTCDECRRIVADKVLNILADLLE